MKKILLLIFISLFIISCEKNDKGQSIKEESVEIIDEYIDTLETSVEDAKDIKILMEERQEIYK